MELAAEEIRVAGDFHDLYVSSIRSGSGNAQAGAGQNGFILPVELIAVAMPLTDLGAAVGVRRLAVWLQLAGPCAQAHGSAQFVNAGQLAQLINDAVRRGRIK